VRYAYTVEGYFKWGHGAYIAAQAKDRGNLAAIYKGAELLPRRRISGGCRPATAAMAGPNMDLGVEYATKSGWDRRLKLPRSRRPTRKSRGSSRSPTSRPRPPQNADAMESEWQALPQRLNWTRIAVARSPW